MKLGFTNPYPLNYLTTMENIIDIIQKHSLTVRCLPHEVVSYWKYKEGDEITEDDGELNNWLRTIKEILDDPQPDAMDFLDAIKLNLFASEIFVFTPKGEIKTMPAGCTALDFAFQIHTFLGSHCIGAKVNHKLVPLSHKLHVLRV